MQSAELVRVGGLEDHDPSQYDSLVCVLDEVGALPNAQSPKMATERLNGTDH
jgi:hypothetical protein